MSAFITDAHVITQNSPDANDILMLYLNFYSNDSYWVRQSVVLLHCIVNGYQVTRFNNNHPLSGKLPTNYTE